MADEGITEYRRKISGEEAQGQFILVVKNAVDFFPKAGKPFKLKVKDNNDGKEKEFEVTLTSAQFWSTGPSKPQLQFKIDTRLFRDIFPIHFGKKVTITKISDSEYSLS